MLLSAMSERGLNGDHIPTPATVTSVKGSKVGSLIAVSCMSLKVYEVDGGQEIYRHPSKRVRLSKS